MRDCRGALQRRSRSTGAGGGTGGGMRGTGGDGGRRGGGPSGGSMTVGPIRHQSPSTHSSTRHSSRFAPISVADPSDGKVEVGGNKSIPV